MAEEQLVKMGSQGRVVIPKAVRDKMELEEGDLIYIFVRKADNGE